MMRLKWQKERGGTRLGKECWDQNDMGVENQVNQGQLVDCCVGTDNGGYGGGS